MSDKAYDRLKGRLLRGEISVGQRLTERALADQLEVSRTPLRMALLKLAHDRLLVRTRAGAWLVPAYTEREIRDLFHCRRHLEIAAALQAIDRASDVELASLEEHLERAENAYEDGDGRSLAEANSAFHSSVYAMTHSMWLRAAMDPLRSHMIRIRNLINVEQRDQPYPEGHREIYRALINRDQAAASKVAAIHVDEDLVVALRHMSVLGGSQQTK